MYSIPFDLMFCNYTHFGLDVVVIIYNWVSQFSSMESQWTQLV